MTIGLGQYNIAYAIMGKVSQKPFMNGTVVGDKREPAKTQCILLYGNCRLCIIREVKHRTEF